MTNPSDAWWLDETRLVVGTAGDSWAGITLDVRELLLLADERIRRDFSSQECEFYNLACAGAP